MRLHLRQDLQVCQRQGKSAVQWVIKDPVGFNHFLFSQEEYFLLQLFDGSRDLKQVQESWQSEFQTRSLTKEQLVNTVHRLLADNLLIADQFGNDKRLRKQREKTATRQLWASLSSPYVFRFGKIDPKLALDVLEIPARVMFHPLVIFANLILATIVLLFFVGHFENVSQHAGLVTDFFSYKNLVVMAIVAVAIKILHELGHALACRRFGGECFEIGVLFIALLPTLYCDVSDSWTFKQKWKRILVSFAGIYVEIMLAVVASICWIATSPGFINTVFFNIAIMCSVSSLLINGNPLLKYDGYYVVSDFFDQPNLSSKAQKQLTGLLGQMVSDSRSTSINFWLCLYGALSLLYRIFVVSIILTGLYLLMSSAGFGRMGNAVIAWLMILLLARNIGPWFSRKVFLKSSLSYVRLALTACFLLLMLGLCSLVALPTYVYCPFAVEPAFSSVAYAPRNGFLKMHVKAFGHVEAGQLLGEIVDESIEQQISVKTQEQTNLQERVQLAVKMQTESHQAVIGVEQLRNQLEKIKTELISLKKESASLLLKSECDGLLTPLPLTPSEANLAVDSNISLPENVFDVKNRNLPVRRGQPLFVVEEAQKSLIAYLDEESVEQLEEGQSAILKFDRQPGKTFNATVKKIVETEYPPTSNANKSSAKNLAEQADRQSLYSAKYRVVLHAEDLPAGVFSGSNGRARISVASRTVFEKLEALGSQWWK